MLIDNNLDYSINHVKFRIRKKGIIKMDEDKIVYLVRHGESWGNIGDKWTIDVPLTELGRTQAKGIEIEVDLVICSPMRRAIETLHYSKIKYREYYFYEMCRERICSKGDCLLLEYDWKPETDDSFNHRVKNTASHILDQLKYYTKIAMVCHGCVIRALTGEKLRNAEVIIADLNLLNEIANGYELNEPCCNDPGW